MTVEDVTLTEAEREALRTSGSWPNVGRDIFAAVERIIAARLDTVRQDDYEALWAHIENLRVEYEAKAANPSARFVRASDVLDDLPVRTTDGPQA